MGHLGARRCCCRWPRAGSPPRASSPCARLPWLLGHPHWPPVPLCCPALLSLPPRGVPSLQGSHVPTQSPVTLGSLLHPAAPPTPQLLVAASKPTQGKGPIWRGVSLVRTSPQPSGLTLGIGVCGGLLEGQGHGEGGVCVCVCVSVREREREREGESLGEVGRPVGEGDVCVRGGLGAPGRRRGDGVSSVDSLGVTHGSSRPVPLPSLLSQVPQPPTPALNPSPVWGAVASWWTQISNLPRSLPLGLPP
ncbi:hypothetical protein HJG60_010038 [Phyllostomus discolor]|uniref:Uncharacterized protein n=1 Tax=Phyllostomus discolor TaxID=89673 RepID=A0A834AXH3_9CHIR|nr:hypothetical protein HJG60_010038 [Phyllostomus discolor]